MAKEERKQEKRDEIDSIMRRRHIIRYSLLLGSIVLLVAILVIAVIALARGLYLKNDHFVFRQLEMKVTPHYSREKVLQILAELPDDEHCVEGRTHLSDVKVGAIRTRLLKEPILKSVEVRRIFPDTISIELTERHPLAYVCGMKREILAMVDNEGVLFPNDDSGKNTATADLPYITRVNLQPLNMGVPCDNYQLKCALELVKIIESKPPVENAAYSIHLVQCNAKYEQFECLLKPFSGNKVFSKEITVKFPMDTKKMGPALNRFDSILLDKLKKKETLKYADMTLEHNVNTL